MPSIHVFCGLFSSQWLGFERQEVPTTCGLSHAALGFFLSGHVQAARLPTVGNCMSFLANCCWFGLGNVRQKHQGDFENVAVDVLIGPEA